MALMATTVSMGHIHGMWPAERTEWTCKDDSWKRQWGVPPASTPGDRQLPLGVLVTALASWLHFPQGVNEQTVVSLEWVVLPQKILRDFSYHKRTREVGSCALWFDGEGCVLQRAAVTLRVDGPLCHLYKVLKVLGSLVFWDSQDKDVVYKCH